MNHSAGVSNPQEISEGVQHSDNSSPRLANNTFSGTRQIEVEGLYLLFCTTILHFIYYSAPLHSTFVECDRAE